MEYDDPLINSNSIVLLILEIIVKNVKSIKNHVFFSFNSQNNGATSAHSAETIFT
jgi:hypothetical protein